jgi:hypothetical protein
MTMKNLLRTSALIFCAALPVQAQNQKLQDLGSTLDDLIVCTMIYSRTSELYNAKALPTKANAFMATSYAYGAVADRIAIEAYGDQVSYDFIDQRMETLAESLNKSAESKPKGELDVLAEWIDYCDAMGPQVESALPSTGLQ